MDRSDLPSVEPTDEDVECFTFRMQTNASDICCMKHHLIMMGKSLLDDRKDAEIFWRGVRTCHSFRWADLAIGEWLIEQIMVNEKKIKKRLDF